MKITIDTSSKVPVYKQLIMAINQLLDNGGIAAGDVLPSMNELSQSLSISRETVKKAYNILREKGTLESAHGKGFYISDKNGSVKKKILMLFDKLSTYKLELYRSFINNVDEHVSVTIHLHYQDARLLELLLEEHAGKFDYYIITPHFPLEPKIQSKVLKLLKKIPNRKLILLDRNIEALPGNFGAIYQDFEKDVYQGLGEALNHLKKYKNVCVIHALGSLYGTMIKKGIQNFCADHKLKYNAYSEISLENIKAGNLYIVLNSQLDVELIDIVRYAKAKKLNIGKDIGIISYNESAINEIILDGLTVLSTDFNAMGKAAAEMVRTGTLSKIRNNFGLIVRATL